MGKKNKNAYRQNGQNREPRLKPETKKSIWGISFLGIAVILLLAWFGVAGPAGSVIFKIFDFLLGWGYLIVPLSLLFVAGILLFAHGKAIVGIALIGIVLLIFGLLGIIEILAVGKGGLLGLVLGSFRIPFGSTTALIINALLSLIGLLVVLDVPLRLRLPRKNREGVATAQTADLETPSPVVPPENAEKEQPQEKVVVTEARQALAEKTRRGPVRKFENYTPPPLSLLSSTVEKPTTGDLRANANIIKRTLESFGIAVEMGEINIGPKVTRYTLKPAEGVKLSRITALGQDLSLALAAHPLRIEAPIPGKSLVGIEVPNKAAAVVRLGSLMAYENFQKTGALSFALGRDVTGEPIFSDIERMPHLLVAGATGSGKSVAIHSLIISLLYKNSPDTLKFIMVDPKRVELSIYENIPHLVSPVITENKKAIGVFRWAIKEMERRYDLLLKAGSRDIKSYNAKMSGAQQDESSPDPLPYLLIIIDEMADLMTSYGREVEGSIVRLAQMARATGLHLILSTQRPSVEIITGLIKANITSRIALQVASQIDSRTILDAAGAEKLLGGGDLLFVSAELSKPKRVQGAYITEEEVKNVANFIREHNPMEFSEAAELGRDFGGDGNGGAALFGEYDESDDDDLYDEAVETVRQAKKASASLLQRRLKVGYARAARLLDIMEERGVVGPGDGAKPRDVFVGAEEKEQSPFGNNG